MTDFGSTEQDSSIQHLDQPSSPNSLKSQEELKAEAGQATALGIRILGIIRSVEVQKEGWGNIEPVLPDIVNTFVAHETAIITYPEFSSATIQDKWRASLRLVSWLGSGGALSEKGLNLQISNRLDVLTDTRDILKAGIALSNFLRHKLGEEIVAADMATADHIARGINTRFQPGTFTRTSIPNTTGLIPSYQGSMDRTIHHLNGGIGSIKALQQHIANGPRESGST